jgi:hypothetical protein
VGAEQAAQQVVLAQDGQQRAQSRRRERNGDRDERPDESDGVQQADDSTGQRRRHQPRQGGAASDVRAQQPLVDLVAGQEEEEPEPDVREDLHVLGRPEPQTLRPDQHPAQEEQDDLRNPRAGQQGEADGGQHRDDGDHEERAERGVHVHRESPLITRIVPEPGDAGQRPDAGP